VNEYQQKEKVAEKHRSLFYFGSMDWIPNQEAAKWFLANCWKQVLAEVPDAKLIIAGRGMPLDFFHITDPHVQIIENVENGKRFYQQHQVMIVPLMSGSGLRIKIIEGMAYGKAIVSTSVGAEGIRCSHGEDIFIADSPSEFTKQVVRLLKDDTLRKNMEKRAAERALKEFDNFNVVSGLVSFYRQLSHV
jgi:glycosyltransferase involved in cell wall biosynthesis